MAQALKELHLFNLYSRNRYSVEQKLTKIKENITKSTAPSCLAL